MNFSGGEFTRLLNNFYNEHGLEVLPERMGIDAALTNYITAHENDIKKKYKVAFCWICLNQPYWPYAEKMIDGAKKFFLPGHNVDYFLWSDIPASGNTVPLDEAIAKLEQWKSDQKNAYIDGYNDALEKALEVLKKPVEEAKKIFGATVFPTESQPWPIPTLMRYHLFLQQEEILKDYDYIFYCDVDMQFVNVVGDEILGEGLTAAPHPGYYIRKELWPPYEPNKQSYNYIQRPGYVINDNGKPRFMPMYFAGGFQGGKAKDYIKAMKEMRMQIDKDMSQNYTPIWNDESVWNKYLEKTPENLKFLTPSYIYPDSLIKEYYEPIVWGCSYQPKLVTLTKKFTLTKEGGEAVERMKVK